MLVHAEIPYGEVLRRRDALKEQILDLMKNPESIKNQEKILFVERYDNCLSLFFYSPVKDSVYHAVPVDCNITMESKHLIFCHERDWEERGCDDSTPVIQLKNGKQIECGILNLNNFEGPEREEIESGFNEVQRIIAEKNATMTENV